MIGLHATNKAIFTSTGEIRKETPFLQWLVSLDTQAIAYDLDAFMASLCKLINLNKEECQILLDKEEYRFFEEPEIILHETKNTATLKVGNDFKIKYFREHFISIDMNKNIPSIHKYINITNAHQTGYLIPHYKENESIADSISKAYHAYSFGLELKEAYQWLGMPTNSLASPISTFMKKYVEDTRVYIPTADDMPEEVSRLSWDTSVGGWIECLSMGHFKNIWDYDMNACFADMLTKIPDFRKGIWIESNDIPDEATFGVCNATLNIEAEFHPFIKKIGRTNYNLNGEYPNTVFLQDIRLLQKYHELGNYKVDGIGYWWIPQGKQFYPYLGMVNWLNNKKQIAIKELYKIVVQRCYSGLNGKTLQSIVKRDKDIFGDYFCPLVGGVVENNSRIALFETCYKHKIVPLDIRIDGFITTQALPLKLSKQMGEWKLNFHGNCFIVNNSLITLDKKDSDDKGEFSLTYDWLMNQIKENPKNKEYTLYKYSPIKLSQSMNDYAFERLGELEKFSYTVNIGDDWKRDFLNRPKCGQDLLNNRYDSVPLLYSFVKQRESIQTKSPLISESF